MFFEHNLTMNWRCEFTKNFVTFQKSAVIFALFWPWFSSSRNHIICDTVSYLRSNINTAVRQMLTGRLVWYSVHCNHLWLMVVNGAMVTSWVYLISRSRLGFIIISSSSSSSSDQWSCCHLGHARLHFIYNTVSYMVVQYTYRYTLRVRSLPFALIYW